MKYSQVYFIRQCEVQNYKYNATDKSREFPVQNLLFWFQ